MFTLTIPRAILLGFLAVALAVGSIPFGMKLMDVSASPGIQRVALCDVASGQCAEVFRQSLLVQRVN